MDDPPFWKIVPEKITINNYIYSALELGIWRIDKELQPVEFSSLELESRLEDILDKDISIASPHWLIIGRQVRTNFDKFIDLLAIDRDGNLVVIELKRDKTYRDIVAQVLDYGSWVRDLEDENIAQIFDDYIKKFHLEIGDISINEAFCKKFGVNEMPDELNEAHELVIVSSNLDPSTERIVTYLAEEHGVDINAVFFRVFRDGEREYLSRAWFREPTRSESVEQTKRKKGEWNEEYYVSFGIGESRDWSEAVKYGFVSGGGGSWYTNTLQMLEPGARVWVNVPGNGYVGVGLIRDTVVPITQFIVKGNKGDDVPITEVSPKAKHAHKKWPDVEYAEHFVRVDWIKTVPVNEAIKEKGFFGNQNTVARPTTPKWIHTVERLKKRFGVK